VKRSLWIVLFIMIGLRADEYKIGSGFKVPDIPLYIGGYVTADYITRKDDYNRLRIDDIAVIAYGNYKRFSYLSEFEIKESYVKEWDKRERENTNTDINIERLYFDYAYSDTLAFRAGKFNTPVGYWNLTPVSALRDSASNPYLSYILYPRYSTGLQMSYEDHLNEGNAYTVMIQHNDDLDNDYNNIFVSQHHVFGVEHTGEEISFKANVGHFRIISDDDFYYFLLSTLYEQELYEISAELGARRSTLRWTVPYALYLQGVYHLAPKHDLIGRFESYKIDEGAYRRENIGVVGYTYRPIYPITYKAEYQLRSYTNESQFKLSFSIMF